ncbi:MAG: hypothetical protein RLZZ271_1548 [Pseudomonadota bacterium]|jgi:hypothetical protein
MPGLNYHERPLCMAGETTAVGVPMIQKTATVLGLLLASTVAGISMSLFGQERWMHAVFWYSSQLLPVLYVALAWWGSQQTGSREDEPFLHSRAAITDSEQPEND